MTEKLYYIDSHMRTFTARVMSCNKSGSGFEIILDKTAFFPEGGGQCADTGVLGGVNVLDAHEHGGDVIHYTDAPLTVGADVNGEIDWEKRFRNMQGHSGEHILSGVVHNLYGFDNVGFHMGADGIIVDFDGYLSPEELSEVELRVNRIIYENRAVTARFPSADELKTLNYRSKLELTENVRIVTIDGCDMCACCAPHVSFTGEVGVLKILESSHRKGGVRLRMLAGIAAFEDYRQKSESVAKISALLSAKQDSVTEAVKKALDEKEKLTFELGGLSRRIIASIAEKTEETDGDLLFFESNFSTDDLRLLCNSVLPKCGGICAAFSGNDNDGYRYIMASSSIDLRAKSKEINTALSGRGGGTPQMIQGSVSAPEHTIRGFFNR